MPCTVSFFTISSDGIDSGSQVSLHPVSMLIMDLVLVTILLADLGTIAVLLAEVIVHLGHPRKKGSIDSVTSFESYTPPTEQAVGVPAAVATTVAEPAPSPVQAIYETVQPTPAPVQYAAPSVTSFGAPSISKKPTRTYRRRTAPVRSTAASKASLKPKTKKR